MITRIQSLKDAEDLKRFPPMHMISGEIKGAAPLGDGTINALLVWKSPKTARGEDGNRITSDQWVLLSPSGFLADLKDDPEGSILDITYILLGSDAQGNPVVQVMSYGPPSSEEYSLDPRAEPIGPGVLLYW